MLTSMDEEDVIMLVNSDYVRKYLMLFVLINKT
jgi:hypothetical protein